MIRHFNTFQSSFLPSFLPLSSFAFLTLSSRWSFVSLLLSFRTFSLFPSHKLTWRCFFPTLHRSIMLSHVFLLLFSFLLSLSFILSHSFHFLSLSHAFYTNVFLSFLWSKVNSKSCPGTSSLVPWHSRVFSLLKSIIIWVCPPTDIVLWSIWFENVPLK